ncbi:beta-lactamase family protein [Antarcticibacterium sp. 1MA-6-2]|uniref:serine hydrolase domain-containing protein n=1 Tax=Antarcticibacterium sp. 1MA-6-2 TaxID=2908210 RepID=UPI001F28E88C|nr:serine hydrolase domain-containing protein [Antarcticibacterium sp. 1MA-6-2]UJH91594.1 beta-lactamase family protein [Antarcticibacterium sp. 1MA-6-2]
MKRKLLLLILFVAFSAELIAQNPGLHNSTLSQAEPVSVGVSPQRLEKIDKMIQDAIADNEIPGAVALIARNGQIVYHKAFGTADASGRKLKKDDIFRLASQSKAITATAVMILWEEGKFQLDDPISKYIPEFSEPKILVNFNEKDSTFLAKPTEKQITIRHLLTHTSGLGYGIIDGDERMKKIYQKAGVTDLFTTKPISIEESVKKLAELPLHHEPGERFTYSEGLDVLGYLIEKVSGKSFDVFLKERIFEPLGMNDTYFYLPENKKDRMVQVQQKTNNGWTKYTSTNYDPDYPVKGAKKFFSGGAGLSGTAVDYAKFLQMYLNGGELNGTRILSRTTIKSIMGDQTGDLWGGGNKHYGLAFGVLTEKGEAAGGEGSTGTFDWGGYFNTQYFADPEEEVIGILLKQTRGQDNDETGWKFRQMVMASVND